MGFWKKYSVLYARRTDMSKILQSVFEIVAETLDEETRVNDIKCNNIVGESTAGNAQTDIKTECSLLADLKARQHRGDEEDDSRSDLVHILRQKYKKRGILVSYDIKGGFLLKRVISKSVEELKELGFEDDIWFDKDEDNPISSSSFVQRLQVAEECNAAIVFVSENYFLTGPSKYEADVFLQRARSNEMNPNGNHFRLFLVKCAVAPNAKFEVFSVYVDLTTARLSQASVAEKASAVVGTLSEQLESCVTFTTKLYRELWDSSEHLGYKGKTVNAWDICDVQEWLGSLGVHERYRVSFEENEVDGFLLESLTEAEMVELLNVDSKLTRHKIVHNLKILLDKEKGTSWDQFCRSRKTRDISVYLVCDPSDSWIAEFIKSDLIKIGVVVHMHEGYGSSKAISSQSKSNARYLTEATSVIFIMSSSTENSHLVFKELLFVAWLDKPIITAVFINSWKTTRYSLKAIVGKKPAINFARKQYLEGLEILRYHVIPSRYQPRVILQQQYIHRMINGVQPLENLLTKKTEDKREVERPKVFLSYHWDVQNKVAKIKEFLGRHGCECCTDRSRAMAVSVARRWEYRIFGSQEATMANTGVLVQEQISYATIVVLCITLKYFHSDNFVKDIQLAQLHQKPVIPILLQWVPRPLESVAAVARKLEMACGLIDMSNEQLFRKNLSELEKLIVNTRTKVFRV